jgi:phosphatidylserine/phosphatidylglycerophosphate/cardiolipin synthase-like enzyme
MALARDVVELAARLREDGATDPFASLARGGLLTNPEFSALVSRVATGSFEPDAAVRLCLQALSIQHEEMRPRLLDAELVATLPEETPGIARPTESVVREMILKAKKEIVLLGYEFTDLDLLRLLAEAATRAVSVVMICDRGRGSAVRVRESWPSPTCRPRVFHDRERVDAALYASMHAKCLLVDGVDLLVTSANFTFHGLHGNIEIGVRLAGSPAAEARKIFSHLVENRIVVELV